MKGYKVFNPDFTCKGFQFAENTEFIHVGNLEICSEGFHFCTNPIDCFRYYSFEPTNIVCEVEARGKVISSAEDSKCVTNKIFIKKTLTWQEVLNMINTGKGNTGRCNTGNNNIGNFNTGSRNSGSHNTGDNNDGDRNVGNYNYGIWNVGNFNRGNFNNGDWNIGRGNISNHNIGHYNTKDNNYGNRNSGEGNIGNYNSGDFNFSDHNSGVFCTETPKIKIFDKPSDWTYRDYKRSDVYTILKRFKVVEWIPLQDMTQEEKRAYPKCTLNIGYLKVYKYKDAWSKFWQSLQSYEKEIIMNMPNFDKYKFYLITGINVDIKNKEATNKK